MPRVKPASPPDTAATELDHRLMGRALALARKGQGLVEPNPMVGCVLARNERIIGEGFHRRFGGPHAEVEAFSRCTESRRGATLYVTLEPCTIFGKTPPCIDRVLESGVGRVVIGCEDPNPAVNGRGVARLRQAGLEVNLGVRAEEARELIAPFATRMKLGRPYVIAKWAQSLDGRLAATSGDSKWISGERSRRMVHELRTRVDAVVVGSGTARTDDPLLTARGVRIRRRPMRVVLDRRLRMVESSRLVGTAGEAPVLILTSAGRASSPKARRLVAAGVEVIGVGRGRSNPSDAAMVRACLAELTRREATNLLLEGGPRLLTSFFQEGVVDEAWVFTAPCLIGGTEAPGAILGKGVARVEQALVPRVQELRLVDGDVFHRLRWTAPP